MPIAGIVAIPPERIDLDSLGPRSKQSVDVNPAGKIVLEGSAFPGGGDTWRVTKKSKGLQVSKEFVTGIGDGGASQLERITIIAPRGMFQTAKLSLAFGTAGQSAAKRLALTINTVES
jgi:hypothetical protein